MNILNYRDPVSVSVIMNIIDWIAAAGLLVCGICLVYLCYTCSSDAAEAAKAAWKSRIGK